MSFLANPMYRVDAFKLWCWRRLLRVSWTTRRSKPSTLREISPEYSLEGLMLKLKLQCFGHLMWKADPLEKSSILGKIEGGRKRVSADEMAGRHHRGNGHGLGQTSGDGEGQGGLVCCGPWSHKELDTTEGLNSNNINNMCVFSDNWVLNAAPLSDMWLGNNFFLADLFFLFS